MYYAPLLTCLIVIATYCNPVAGAPVSILNPSFEAPSVGDGSFNNSIITDWTISGGGSLPAGVFNPVAGSHYTGPGTTDGVQTAYSNGGIISQVLGDVLQANTVYTLMVDVGDRRDTNFSGYLIELLAGTAVLSTDNNSLAPNDGFLTSIVTYTALPSDTNLGMPLGISLRALSGIQTNFDNVRLDATTIPEPTTGILLLAGAGIALCRRCRV